MRRITPLKTLLKKTLSHLASTISSELRTGPQSRVKPLLLHVNQSPTDNQRTGPSRRGKPVDCNQQIHASNNLTSSYTLIYKPKPIGLLPPHTPIKRTKINQYEPTAFAHYTSTCTCTYTHTVYSFHLPPYPTLSPYYSLIQKTSTMQDPNSHSRMWRLISLDKTPSSVPGPAPDYAEKSDPRAQNHIPLFDRHDARLTKQLHTTPRRIPLDPMGTDPRAAAQPPTFAPNLERSSTRA